MYRDSNVMTEIGQLISEIEKGSLGKKGLMPDYIPTSKFSHYFGTPHFFALSRKSCIGFILPTDSRSDGYIVLVHKSLNDIKNDMVNLTRKITPDVIVTFRKESAGTIQPLLGGEGSKRIDMRKFANFSEGFWFLLAVEIGKKVASYNYNLIRQKRKQKK